MFYVTCCKALLIQSMAYLWKIRQNISYLYYFYQIKGPQYCTQNVVSMIKIQLAIYHKSLDKSSCHTQNVLRLSAVTYTTS